MLFKVGLDFIDFGYYVLVVGWFGCNFDLVLVGEWFIGFLYVYGVVGVDIVVIEGVLGLFDGCIGFVGGVFVVGFIVYVVVLFGVLVILVVDVCG